MACLCAPTSHEGSFRCRLHRGLNPTPNPSQSIPNHQIKGVNHCTNSINAISNQIICCNIPHFTVRESSASAAASTTPHPFDDQVIATDHLNSMRTRSSTSPSPNSCTLSSTSPWSSSSYRSSSSSASSVYTQSASSSSSSRASASSSSSSPSSPFFCMRPPAGKRTSSPSKSPYRLSSSPSPSSTWCGANGTTPSASHAAALAIMKQHSHNKHGAPRTHNRNILSPTSASKIGPSRLSRMAVACADELPLLKDDHCISNLPRHGTATDTFSGSFGHGTATDTFSGSFAETAAPREFASFKAEPSIGGLKTRFAVNKFKQSESSCRIVGSKGGSLIMPTVY